MWAAWGAAATPLCIAAWWAGGIIGGGGSVVFLGIIYLYQTLLYLYHPPRRTRKEALRSYGGDSRRIFRRPFACSSKSNMATVSVHKMDESDRTVDPRVVIIYFHGNACDAVSCTSHIRNIQSHNNARVYVIEYRGYGGNPGIPHETAIVADSVVVTRWICKKEGNHLPIVLFGASLGMAVVIQVRNSFSYGTFAGIILENGFTSLRDMMRVVVPRCLRWVWFLSTETWDSLSAIKNLTEPVMFLRSSQDEVIPSHMMRDLYNECPSKEKEYCLFFCGHSQIWNHFGSKANEKLCRFIDTVIKKGNDGSTWITVT